MQNLGSDYRNYKFDPSSERIRFRPTINQQSIELVKSLTCITDLECQRKGAIWVTNLFYYLK